MTPLEPESVRSALGIKPGVRVWVGGHNPVSKRAVEALLTDATRPPSGPVDLAFVAPESAGEGAYFLAKIEARLDRLGVAWMILPPNAPADDLSERGVESALLRHSDRIIRSATEPIPLPDGCIAYAFGRPR